MGVFPAGARGHVLLVNVVAINFGKHNRCALPSSFSQKSGVVHQAHCTVVRQPVMLRRFSRIFAVISILAFVGVLGLFTAADNVTLYEFLDVILRAEHIYTGER